MASDRPLIQSLSKVSSHSPELFRNVVRPALRKIILQYQSFIKELAPEIPLMAPLQDDLLTLKDSWQIWPNNCDKEYSDECAQALLILLHLHQKIESQSLSFSSTPFLQDKSRDHSFRLRRDNFERGLELFQSLDSLADLASISSSQLEWAIALYRKRMGPSLDLLLPIQKMADQMLVQWEVAHVNLSSGEQRNDFRILYAQFIRPLTILERHAERYELFFQQLDDLNFSINYFHRIVTKSKRPWPGRTEQLTESMKEDWNMILRQIYR